MNKQQRSNQEQTTRQQFPGTSVMLRIVRLVAVLSTLMLLALVLVGSLVIVQGQRDETRPADAIVVLHADTLTNAHLAHAQELYQRRLANRLLLIADDPLAVQADLVAEGMPKHALLPVKQSEASRADFQNIAEIARQHSIQSILIVSAPSELLLDLKMARDQGLVAHGAPVSTMDFEPRTLLHASLNYWLYVLFASG